MLRKFDPPHDSFQRRCAPHLSSTREHRDRLRGRLWAGHCDAFLQHYGEESVFVTATVDCLTTRFVGVLKSAGRVPEDHEAVQYGPPEMREALEQLVARLAAQGLDKPYVLLMRSAVGHEAPQAFLDEAGSLLGLELLTAWLRQLEGEDYLGASALLTVQ